MSSVVISGDTSGSITLQAPAVAGTTTLNLPATTGTVMVSGNMPAVSYYASTAFTISASTYVKVPLDTKIFDTTSSSFNTSTYRFTPTVAGYYQISGQVVIGTISATGRGQIMIYKNGNIYSCGNWFIGNGSNSVGSTISSIVYLNGSTDYIELYVYQNGVSSTTASYQVSAADSNYINACLLRAA